jgi:hypothetical protein
MLETKSASLQNNGVRCENGQSTYPVAVLTTDSKSWMQYTMAVM